ncbi:hypothetical protein IJ732_01580, partial [bacterium]|nr:hypothetical protein [bacterium]
TEPTEPTEETIVDEQSEQAEQSEEAVQAETEQTEQTEPTEPTEETIVDEQSEQAEQSEEDAQAETEQTEPTEETIVDEQSEQAEQAEQSEEVAQAETEQEIVFEEFVDSDKSEDDSNEVIESFESEKLEIVSDDDNIDEPIKIDNLAEDVQEPELLSIFDDNSDEEVDKKDIKVLETVSNDLEFLKDENQGSDTNSNSNDEFEMGSLDDLFDDLDDSSYDEQSDDEKKFDVEEPILVSDEDNNKLEFVSDDEILDKPKPAQLETTGELGLSIIDDMEQLETTESLNLKETSELKPLVLQDDEPENKREEEVFEYSFVMDSVGEEERDSEQKEVVDNTPVEIQPKSETEPVIPSEPQEVSAASQEAQDLDTADISDIADLSELDDFFGDNDESVVNSTETTENNEEKPLTVDVSSVPVKQEKDIAPAVPQVDLTSDILGEEQKTVVDLDKEIEQSVRDDKKGHLKVLFNRQKSSASSETASSHNDSANDTLTVKNLVVMISSICLLFTSLVALGTFIGIKLSDGVKTKSAEALKPETPAAPPEEEKPLITQENLSTEPISAKVSNISWEVPESLAYNDVIREYLQIAGKNVKLNLQNELILTSEYSYSQKVVVDMLVTKSGDVSKLNVSTSSGSKAIDHIIVNTVRDTLKYLKMPAGELTEDVELSLVVSF